MYIFLKLTDKIYFCSTYSMLKCITDIGLSGALSGTVSSEIADNVAYIFIVVLGETSKLNNC